MKQTGRRPSISKDAGAPCRLTSAHSPVEACRDLILLALFRRVFKRGYVLGLLGAVEYGVPFIRMLIMTRLLDLRQLGIASAIAATYGAVELVTESPFTAMFIRRQRMSSRKRSRAPMPYPSSGA